MEPNEDAGFNEREKVDELVEEMKGVTSVKETLLARMFTSTVKELIAKIEAGKASPGDIANAIRILKDNNITMDVGDEDEENDLDKLADCVLPDVDEMEKW